MASQGEVENKLLCDLLQKNSILLGGSSVGIGLRKAARYHIGHKLAKKPVPSHFQLEGASRLNSDVVENPLEDSFYVCDVGVVMSQLWQWKLHFPRVEPFYAVKCNPDPIIVRTLAILGANFDCASRNEIRLVQEQSADLPRQPEIIYANPCKARAHLIEAVCKGVTLVTFDNAAEVAKCAAVSKDIQLILRIITDDSGSQCRLSTKFGAPRTKWRSLLAAAQHYGLQVVGVSFHVGSGCRDASRYELALKDAREIFDMAEKDFGFNMTILDIGGGFPGETHSIWNPADLDPEDTEEEKKDTTTEEEEGVEEEGEEEEEDDHFMFFTEIAEKVRPMLDELFPEGSGVRLIAEPGRYFVAASATLIASVVSCRDNAVDTAFAPCAYNDKEAASSLSAMDRDEEKMIVRKRGLSFTEESNPVLENIAEELADYSKLYAMQNLAQQEADVYNDRLDLYKEGFDTAVDLLGPPTDEQKKAAFHSVEGINKSLVEDCKAEGFDDVGLLSLGAAGEAAVSGLIAQVVADSDLLQDDYAYYINDGVYGAFNNIMFDHATIRPRLLQKVKGSYAKKVTLNDSNGFSTIKVNKHESSDSEDEMDRNLFPSTVFGPTCDSIDVIARSALLPKLKVGEWLYFQNMGAYTMAAASCFNGFTPTEKVYVCSINPQFFQKMMLGPKVDGKC